MAKQVHENNRMPRKSSATGFGFHLTDKAEYQMGALNTGGDFIPVLGIYDAGNKVDLFFETTAQVERLRDKLTAFLRNVEITQRGPVEA